MKLGRNSPLSLLSTVLDECFFVFICFVIFPFNIHARQSLPKEKFMHVRKHRETTLLGVVKESSRDLLNKRNPNRLTPSLRPLYSSTSLFFLHHIFVFVRGNDCQCSKKKKR